MSLVSVIRILGIRICFEFRYSDFEFVSFAPRISLYYQLISPISVVER